MLYNDSTLEKQFKYLKAQNYHDIPARDECLATCDHNDITIFYLQSMPTSPFIYELNESTIKSILHLETTLDREEMMHCTCFRC